jgi:hypothetical protein
MFVGPSGSGKLSEARKWIEEAHNTKLVLPLESRVFQIGDGYEARVLASPYHFEIDIPNLSMQDKQIIGDLLTTFFSSRDVLSSLRSSTRKLVILRRAHSLSLPAAIRVRAILQQYVMPPDVTGMIWITAREITGSLALLEDTFARYRVPRLPQDKWNALEEIPEKFKTTEAWEKCDGRPERIAEILKFFPDGNLPGWPRRIQDFYDEMMEIIIKRAKMNTPPNIDVILWIRGRIYQALSLCQAGPDIIDSCAAAITRLNKLLEPQVFWKVMSSLTIVEPHTSYRTPLSLESGVLNIYETIRMSTEKKDEIITNGSVVSNNVVVVAKECDSEEGNADAEPAACVKPTKPTKATKTTKPKTTKTKPEGEKSEKPARATKKPTEATDSTDPPVKRRAAPKKKSDS